MKKKNYNNWHSTESMRSGEYTTNEPTKVPLNIDLMRAEGKIETFLKWVKEQESRAVKHERFEEAVKWRDVPKNGIIRVNLREDETWEIID
tara:strand:+ start:1226 stop:1498 length:273 start_codon:yes stop_codon:yes gene_type:complete